MARIFASKGFTCLTPCKHIFESKATMCKVPDWSYGKVNLQWNEGKFKKGARRPKLAKELSRNQLDALKESTDPTKKYWHEEPILMKSPLSRNKHPVSQWAEEEEAIKQNSIDKGFSDAPIEACDDPYAEEPMRCVLCPKNFSVPIRPSWKNPKLLSQFVSPHTGLVYKKHITGLCEFMQCEVEREVKRAQQFGYMSTKMKDVIYLKDPPLFDATRPTRKNPH